MMERNAPPSSPRRPRIHRAAGCLALAAFGTGGCLQMREDHCIAKGGDAYCSETYPRHHRCAMSPDDTPDPPADGCMLEVPPELVHVEFGLPRTGDELVDTISRTGATCGFGQVEALQEAYARLYHAVIDPLDGRSRVRRRSLPLRSAIEAFNTAVRGWMSEHCEQGTDETGSTGTEGDGDTSGGPSSSTSVGPEACASDDDCPEATPICDTAIGTCVRCDQLADPDHACAARDPDRPQCSGSTCVPCTDDRGVVCADHLLVCGPVAGACASCTEHAQCESGACDIFEGICFDPSTVLHVGNDGGAKTIAVALAGLPSLWPDRLGLDRGVLVMHGGVPFDETAVIRDQEGTGTNAEAIAFIAAPGQAPRWTKINGGSGPILSVSVGARAYLDGMVLRENQGSTNTWGVQCANARVDIRRSQIVQNDGGGIDVGSNCELKVENSFVGGDVVGRDAIRVEEGSAIISYSTLGAGRSLPFGDLPAALRCDPNDMSVTVRNSLLVARAPGDEIVCLGAVLQDNATEADLGDMDPDWFTNFKTGNLHLDAAHAPLDEIRRAQWAPGDPTTDIDGDPRSTAEDELDYVGADVPLR